MSETENIVSINQPINPWMMAKYRGNPLIGISPNPKVVNVLIESIKAFRILMNKS